MGVGEGEGEDGVGVGGGEEVGIERGVVGEVGGGVFAAGMA